MKPLNHNILILLCLILLAGCQESDEISDSRQWTEQTVAVVLPMNKGLDQHWKRTLGLLQKHLEQAFRNQTAGIRLNFEYYDENTEQLSNLANQLAKRPDIYAVIGGLYSSNATILATELAHYSKEFFTLATTEELVRAHANSGHLWAMTETDITQCEVLLSKVINYDGKSVALLVKENDSYGKTFIDWFAFQAKELGLENKGTFTYRSDNVAEVSQQAAGCGAEYVICTPSEIEEIAPMLRMFQQKARTGMEVPRPLFADTAYGADVIATVGPISEGMEGITFGASPESGFEVSYETYFGESTTLGEAQVYDAAMLLAYAAWYQVLNPDTTLQKALRTLVTGKDANMGSWMGEDIRLVIDALANGKQPSLEGASGSLDFDAKVFTNVLTTTYYNFKVYNGKYIILDYNTSDGSNRTDATLAGWNWKASQMQDFNDSESMTYPEYHSNWALLVATSTTWNNYRHQADILAIYQQLKASGYPDDHIILILEDDIAYSPSNPHPGIVQVTLGGKNLYENVEIDYKMSELQPHDFLRILSGQSSPQLPKVIESTQYDNVFIFWSGHGMPKYLCWNQTADALSGDDLRNTFSEMHQQKRYRKLLMMVETCFSGGVVEACEGIPGLLFFTAANGDETSKADIFNEELNVWMSNRFTSTCIEQLSAQPDIRLRDLYYRLFINTVGSHVMVYNAPFYGNMYQQNMGEFIQFR